MILDKETTVSDAQALSATALSTNAYDSGAAGNDISVGEPLVLALTVDVAADFTTGDETYTVDVIQSANANLSSSDILARRAILASALTIGSKHYIPLPQGSKTKRYLGANFTLAGTTPSVTVTAMYMPASMIQGEKVYADNITIS